MIKYKFIVCNKKKTKDIEITIADEMLNDEIVVEKLECLINNRPSLRRYEFYTCIERSVDKRG